MNVSDAELNFDVVVVGGGMAGFTAGSAAARQGKSVLLVEKGRDVGGTSAISGGVLWTSPTFEEWRERCPLGIESLGRALVDGFPGVIDWLKSLSIGIESSVQVHDFAPGYPFDILGYFQRATRIIESEGGFVMNSTTAKQLLTGTDDIEGILVTELDGTDVVLRTNAIVLATGGLQGNPAARARFIHPNAQTIPVRANPRSVGDGLRMATEIGAGTHQLSTGFYGHLICSPLESFTEKDFNPLYMHFSHLCVMVNVKGDRFTVERAGDHFNAQALVAQPGSRGLMIFDDQVYRNAVITPNVERFVPFDKFELARSRGANTAVADTLQVLATTVSAWGFDPKGVVRSVEEFNSGTHDPIPWTIPVRAKSVLPLTESPFYAMEVAPSVTFAHSGIRIDSRARVLRNDDTPIRGLYACGADVGGVYDRGYCGGLALGGVFGLAAARDLIET